MKQSRSILIGLLMLSVLAVGCSTIRLTGYWMDENYKGPAFKKFLVVSLAAKMENRIMLEDHFVEKMKKKGTVAVASYTVLPPDGTVNKDVIRTAVEDSDIDAVILGRLIDVEQHKNQNLPDVPVGGDGLYKGTTYEWYQPGRDYKVYKIQTTVWQVSTEKMIWKAEADVLDPQNIKKETGRLAAEIVKDLRRVKLL